MKKFFHSSKGEDQAHTYTSSLEEKVKNVISSLTGIGFTMSLFISNVSFADAELILLSKGAILFGSVISALLGIFSIRALETIKHGIAS